MSGTSRGLVVRLAAAGLLAVIAAALLFLGASRPGDRPRAERALPSAGSGQIDSVVDALLTRYGIAPPGAAARRVRRLNSDFERIEEHIPVSSGFVGLEFNRDLNKRLAPLGASVFGTERTNETSVTMHIVRGGMTIRSIVFTVEKEE